MLINRLHHERVHNSPSRLGSRLAAFAPTLAIALLVAGCGASLKESVRREIGTQMTSQRLELRRCYRHALQRNRATAGNVTLRFQVATGSGEVHQVSVHHSDLKDDLLKRCLLSRVRKLRLGVAPELPVVVTYPVRFELETPVSGSD